LKSSHQVAKTTANLKHALTWANQEAIDLLKPPMVYSAPAFPFIAFVGDGIPMGDVSLLVNLTPWVEEVIVLLAVF
jgi:hypothetical protein